MSKEESLEEEIRRKVATDPRWACRAVLALYRRQTLGEQHAGRSVHQNSKGFNGVDAKILTSFAKQMLKGYTMSAKQMAIIYKKMPKYAKQLALIVEEALTSI